MRKEQSMNTFKNLYEFLQLNKENDILTWLEEPWVGKDKQESLLRLFAGLGLIDKIKNFHICHGNFNKKTIEKNINIKNVFYDKKNKIINLKDKGDSSDLTGVHKDNDKHLLVTTSKNINKTQVGKLDIDKILTNFQQYKNYKMTLCVCIRYKRDLENMIKRIEHSNSKLKTILEQKDTIIIDWYDLNQAYHQFKIFYRQTRIENIMKSNKTTLCLKMHQHLGVFKTLKMKDSENKKILWGHIQRSGKSYIIGGCIIEDSKDKDECNYLIITTAPNETEQQYYDVFNHLQFIDFNVFTLKKETEKEVKQLTKTSKKNIIIVSDMYIKNTTSKNTEYCDDDSKIRIKKIKWLKDLHFKFVFLDESHKGGTTKMAKKMMNYYGYNATQIYITATYSKPINDYDISKDCWILWDIEDIKLCKNIKNESSIIRLVEKHGVCIQDIISKYSHDSIISEYSKYPDLWLLTDKINEEVVTEIVNDTHDNNYGWSPDACFLLKQSIKKDKETHKSKIVIKEEFQNEGENLKLWYRIFGKKNKFGIPDKDYPDDIVFMKRIEKICKDPTIDSRFIGEGDFRNEPMIIMAFLPQNNINKISNATIELIERNKIIQGYDVISINSKITNNPKDYIESARCKAKNSGKKGVLVLSGRQCSLGVSIDNCDIVLLLNNNMGFDMIYQMMFRCMTEGKNKKCGFVVDLNIHRVIETSIINYASLIKPDIHPIEATKFVLQERIINLNGDHWMPSFGNDVSKIAALCKNVYEMYSSNTENALHHFLNRLRFKEILLTKEEQMIFNAMFSNTTPTKNQKELIDILLKEDDDKEKIKKGIEKTKNEDIDASSETSNEDKKDKKDEKQVNYMDILKHIIPLICLLTIHNNKTSFEEMFNFIEQNPYVYNILIDQTKSWWGKSIDSKIIKKFINVYMKYMKNDKETNQIIRTVKELFMKNIKNNRELSNLIDKYLIPQELEKKSNAEVSTPFKLRQEMLDKIPLSYWTSLNKTFEPCSGKGGFVIDIIDRFMNGLVELIPDDKLRYKTIVEECLYFSDINPTNIFICKLLIDPYNEYELNYNEGNTLELDIKEKWNIEGFDAVIGNPPYQENDKNNKSKGGTNLYTKFINYSFKYTIEDGYLLYITPISWLGPSTNKQMGNNLLHNLFMKYDLIVLNLNECKKYFNIGSTFSYYLIQKKITSNLKTNVISRFDKKSTQENINFKELISFKFLPIHINNNTLNLIKNITNNKNKLKVNRVRKLDTSAKTKIHLSTKQSDIFKFITYHTTTKTFYSDIKLDIYENTKILLNMAGYLKPQIENNCNVTESKFYIIPNNDDECNKIFQLLNSNEVIEYLKLCKYSGFNSRIVLESISFN